MNNITFHAIRLMMERRIPITGMNLLMQSSSVFQKLPTEWRICWRLEQTVKQENQTMKPKRRKQHPKITYPTKDVDLDFLGDFME